MHRYLPESDTLASRIIRVPPTFKQEQILSGEANTIFHGKSEVGSQKTLPRQVAMVTVLGTLVTLKILQKKPQFLGTN